MTRTATAAGLALSLAALAGAAHAQTDPGETIYKSICQGCHMPDAKGAQGAGAYPALAGNKKLAAKAYPALVVLRGQKAMPSFGSSFSDAQAASVVNYVRTHFGNSFGDAITPEEVKTLRPASQKTLGPVLDR